MATVSKFVMQHQLASIHQQLGQDIGRALERLNHKLNGIPKKERMSAAREFAELREAKSLMNSLKYPDSSRYLRCDELAWALKWIKESDRAEAGGAWAGVLDKTARILDIDLSDAHPMPLDLEHRISNELALVSSPRVPSVSLEVL